MTHPTQLSRPVKLAMIEHLEHEVAMFCGALAEFTERDVPDVRKLKRDDPVRIRRTAFLEVVLLHARLLDEFLGTRPKPTHPDDFWAGNFISGTPGWNPIRPLDGVAPSSPTGLSVRDSINKQLAHMTTERLQQADFRLRDLADEILRGMRDFVHHPAILGDPDFERINVWLYATWSSRQPPVVAGS
jgi:hypothetical protein